MPDIHLDITCMVVVVLRYDWRSTKVRMTVLTLALALALVVATMQHIMRRGWQLFVFSDPTSLVGCDLVGFFNAVWVGDLTRCDSPDSAT